jgi:histidine triad (HIT) family protein
VPDCVICREASGDGAPLAFADNSVAVFPAALQPEQNRGSVLVATIEHIETLYDVPDELCGALMARLRDVARVVQIAAGADGTTIRQNNRPPGQDVAHVHFHVAPRFLGDGYWAATAVPVSWNDRIDQARRIAVLL